MLNLPRNTVRILHFAVEAELSIIPSRMESCACPFPTIIGAFPINLAPESINVSKPHVYYRSMALCTGAIQDWGARKP